MVEAVYVVAAVATLAVLLLLLILVTIVVLVRRRCQYEEEKSCDIPHLEIGSLPQRNIDHGFTEKLPRSYRLFSRDRLQTTDYQRTLSSLDVVSDRRRACMQFHHVDIPDLYVSRDDDDDDVFDGCVGMDVSTAPLGGRSTGVTRS
ncbi:PREDICTED: uncharacterized protein LOC106813881 [Priapulus caudatus]|uniref:Uncharacterized protein LOC106813881 n=1 Tax=Priapulus caudatus TaxID=37621 RepID=A0ABM1EN41_PRICU|nr:PREDICTED: uncharacterized protein LOC106813881 [Priapulus caudatus]